MSPKLNTTSGRMCLGILMPNADSSKILNCWVKEAKVIIIIAGEEGQFTLHCFHRGGLQHEFLHASHGRKPITLLKWWGGCSTKEKVDTVMKYLIEELEREENDHRDIFSLIREVDRITMETKKHLHHNRLL